MEAFSMVVIVCYFFVFLCQYKLLFFVSVFLLFVSFNMGRSQYLMSLENRLKQALKATTQNCQNESLQALQTEQFLYPETLS